MKGIQFLKMLIIDQANHCTVLELCRHTGIQEEILNKFSLGYSFCPGARKSHIWQKKNIACLGSAR